MVDPETLKTEIRTLRYKAVINHFKHMLISDLHIPGKPQAATVFDKLHLDEDNQYFSQRTWEGWFSGEPTAIQIGKVQALDRLVRANRIALKFRADPSVEVPENYYEKLLYGGLVGDLLSLRKSKNVRRDLYVKACSYFPPSPLHLYLDAIELHTIVEDLHDVPWTEVLKTAASRVLELMDELWGPRKGRIYENLSSNLKLALEQADTDERERIKLRYSRLTPNIIEKEVNKGAYPDWELIGVSSDAPFEHIYKTLFSMLRNPPFLVADRVREWIFGLATAGLAMHALAWSDRYSCFGAVVTQEMIFWNALYHLLGNTSTQHMQFIDGMSHYLEPVFTKCGIEQNEKAFEILFKAIGIYKSELYELSITNTDVTILVKNFEEQHPVVYLSENDLQ